MQEKMIKKKWSVEKHFVKYNLLRKVLQANIENPGEYKLAGKKIAVTI